MAGGAKRRRVAIVGSGISGLSCAFLLSKYGDCDVTIFEREKILGMDSQSVDARIRGEKMRLDTPPRAFSEGFYPNLMALYAEANVEIEYFNWATSYSVLGSARAFLRMGSRYLLGWSIPELPGVLNLRWLAFLACDGWRIMRDTVHFHWHCKRLEEQGLADDARELGTLGDFLKSQGYSRAFVDVLMPIVSMICTCSYKACEAYPMALVLRYFNRNSLHQYHAKHGSQDVVKRLSSGASLRLGCRVSAVRPAAADGAGPTVSFRPADEEEERSETFDAVVVAAQASCAARLVGAGSPRAAGVLSRIEHEESIVVIHRDVRLMPRDRRDWSPMNVILPPGRDRTMFTMWCSAASEHWHDEGEKDALLQTWNPLLQAPDGRLQSGAAVEELAGEVKRITFQRPVLTLRSLDAIDELHKIQGGGGIYFAGAYALKEIPLQENGVRSAMTVGGLLGVRCPWQQQQRAGEASELKGGASGDNVALGASVAATVAFVGVAALAAYRHVSA